MPELDGLEVLKQVRADADPPEVIIITGNGTIETAISAMKLGAYDYMSKPYRMAEIDVLVRRAWEKRRLARENVLLQSQLDRAGGADDIETQYAPLQAVLEVIGRVAPSDSPVLISGESGTGKELVAHMLHRMSGRSGPFVDVSCAALSEGLLESELFGHERGAFPGAEERKLGLMELAAAAPSSSTRSASSRRSCRASCFGRSSSAASIASAARRRSRSTSACSPRPIATSRRAWPRERSATTCSTAINTIAIELPPLRDRAVDIPLLARQFLKHFGKANPPTLAPDAVELLVALSVARQRARAAERDRARRAARDKGRIVRASDLPLALPGAWNGAARRRHPPSRWLSSSAGTSSRCCTRRAGTRVAPRRRSASAPRRCTERSASTDSVDRAGWSRPCAFS